MDNDARINAIRAAHRRWLRAEGYTLTRQRSQHGEESEVIHYLETSIYPTTVEPRTRWGVAS